jgi:hypothetical protein
VLKSALKTSTTKAPPPKVITLPDLPFQAIIYEGSVDFPKPDFSKFEGDLCKKVVHAFEQLLFNRGVHKSKKI